MSVGIVDKSTGERIQTAGNPLDKVGDLTNLTTTAKDNAVAAINEVNAGLAGKQNTLTFDDAPTDGSNNPVKSNGIYDALALKQNATDNSLDTDAKTIVGAINEHEGDIGSLKSGFTNLDNEVNGDATVYPYADVITIEDAVPSNLADCNVKIEPVQDLHGQSAPYVGGAGKNLLETPDLNTTHGDVAIVSNKDDAGNVLSITFTGTTSASANNRVLKNGLVLPAGTYKVTNKLLAGTATANKPLLVVDIPNATSLRVPPNYTYDLTLSEETTLGNIYYNFGDSAGLATNYTAQAMICSASASEPTIFAPYTNICPISGHTEASVQRDGKNLYSGGEAGMINQGTGEDEPSGIVTRSYFINVGSSNSIALSHFDATSSGVRVFYYGKNKVYMTSQVFNFDANNSIIVSRPNGCEWIRFQAGIAVYLPTSSIQVELGSSATDYEPFKGKTYTIAFKDGQGNTVTLYDAEGDVNTGAFTVTHGIVDMGTLSWTKITDGLYRAEQSGMKNTADDEIADMLCETYFPDMYSRLPAGSIALRYTNQIWVRDSTVADATELITNLDGKKLCYPLGTPTTLQLDPTKIQLLQGTNIIFCSTGDISVSVNGVAGAIGQLQTQANATDAALAELADQLPTAPTTDGAYVLTVTVADGTPTYSWESAT